MPDVPVPAASPEGAAPAEGARPRSWHADVPRRTRGATLFGFSVVAACILGFGYWGNAAPIAGAVVATGVFVTTGQNKIVQHLEGGVIREILVREGDTVEEGQALVRLDETAPEAELRRLVLRQARLVAVEARLQSEIDERPDVLFPTELRARTPSDPDVEGLMATQRQTFAARRSAMASEIAVLRDGIAALEERIAGTKLQQGAVHQQLGFVEEELGGKNQLLEKGYIRKPEILALERARANLRGEVGRLTGEIGDTKERIARARERIIGVRKAAIKAAAEQAHEIAAELNDVRERIRSAAGILNRVRIAAPVRGVVVKMRYHTAGGVIEAGKNVMEIVPLHEELIIEARVRPQDVDHVKRGQAAVVRLTALNQRVTPMVKGEVVYMSADALPDEKAQAAKADLYVARVKLDAEAAKAVRNFTPTPGMPAEVYIQTSERTFFEYVMKPVMDSMSRAFRES